MAFSSLSFIFIFLPLTIILYYLPFKGEKANKFRTILLIVLSLVFYAWGAIQYLPLLVIMTLANYIFLRIWLKYRLKYNNFWTKATYVLAIILNIAVLAWGKYFSDVLPLGLSFYLFKLLSANFDLRKAAKENSEAAEPLAYKEFLAEQDFSFRKYSLYITFFPELISGPISRFKNFTPQVDTARPSAAGLARGLSRFLPALFIKVLLADPVNALRTDLISDFSNLAAAEAWLASILYTIYIYLDFASYSAMAISVGEMLGYEIPENFNEPYTATSITDFWRRWHMSLSFWFRDYVYIPLGGNRKGKARQLLNLTIVWALTGIWHGNHLNFLLWGLFYAVILIFEKLFLLDAMKNWNKHLKRIITLIVTNFAWVLFAFSDKEQLFSFLGAMFGANGASNGEAIYVITGNVVLLVLAILASTPLLRKLREKLKTSKNYNTRPAFYLKLVIFAILFVFSVSYMLDQSFASFLYFQF